MLPQVQQRECLCILLDQNIIMTVQQKIFELNTKFQKSYHADDWQFFSFTMRDILDEMELFVNSIIGSDHKFRQDIELKTLIPIELERQSAFKCAALVNPNCQVKDNYLNSAKKNISEALNHLYRQLASMDAPMLQKVL